MNHLMKEPGVLVPACGNKPGPDDAIHSDVNFVNCPDCLRVHNGGSLRRTHFADPTLTKSPYCGKSTLVDCVTADMRKVDCPACIAKINQVHEWVNQLMYSEIQQDVMRARERLNLPNTDARAVRTFTLQMHNKLVQKAREGRHGWQECRNKDLAAMFLEHILKGDMVDVANFAMFLHFKNGGPILAEMFKEAISPVGKSPEGANNG